MKLTPLIIMATIVLSACNQDKLTNETETNQGSPTQRQDQVQGVKDFKIEHLGARTVLKDDLSNLDEFIENINVHKMRLTANAGINSKGSVQCKKLVAGQLDNIYSAKFNEMGKSTELILPIFHSDPIQTEFNCQVLNNTGSQLSEINFTIPKNVVVRSKTTLPELHNQKIGTLLLTEDAEIITEGRDLKLQTKELVSLGGRLSTFDELSVALTQPDTRGRKGGRITLHTDKATGLLTVNLRGTNGGKQTFVPQRPPQAARGADGTCSNRRNIRSCDGQNGAPGLPALNGIDGFPGGDSGSIKMIVTQKSDFEVILNYEPGQGSKGGKPSLPGEGGNPGAAGSMSIPSSHCGGISYSPESSKCLDIAYGNNGAPGPLGLSGVEGLPGAPGEQEASRFINIAESQDEFIRDSWSNLKGYL